MSEQQTQFRRDLESVINRNSKENGSDTPDFILAGYLEACLVAYDATVIAREQWYGRAVGKGAAIQANIDAREAGRSVPGAKPTLQVHPVRAHDVHNIDPTVPPGIATRV